MTAEGGRATREDVSRGRGAETRSGPWVGRFRADWDEAGETPRLVCHRICDHQRLSRRGLCHDHAVAARWAVQLILVSAAPPQLETWDLVNRGDAFCYADAYKGLKRGRLDSSVGRNHVCANLIAKPL